jgi:hypothetical protein
VPCEFNVWKYSCHCRVFNRQLVLAPSAGAIVSSCVFTHDVSTSTSLRLNRVSALLWQLAAAVVRADMLFLCTRSKSMHCMKLCKHPSKTFNLKLPVALTSCRVCFRTVLVCPEMLESVHYFIYAMLKSWRPAQALAAISYCTMVGVLRKYTSPSSCLEFFRKLPVLDASSQCVVI